MIRKQKFKSQKDGYEDLSPFFQKFFARFGFFKIEGRGKPYYAGTKDGKIYRVTAANKLKEMKDRATVKQYGKVDLKQSNGTFKSERTHRLIGAFIPNPEHKPVVNHKEIDRNKNSIKDLEWATYKENAQHYQNYKKSIDGKD